MPGQNSVAQLSSELQHNMQRGEAGTATSTAPLLRSDELLNAISTLVANAHPTALRDAEGLLLAAQNALRSASHRYGAPAFSSEDGACAIPVESHYRIPVADSMCAADDQPQPQRPESMRMF